MITFGLNLFGGAGGGDVYYLNIGTDLDVLMDSVALAVSTESDDIDLDHEQITVDVSNETENIDLIYQPSQVDVDKCQ
jgi:hypothetical protein